MSRTAWFFTILILIAVFEIGVALLAKEYYFKIQLISVTGQIVKEMPDLKFLSSCLGIVFPSYAFFYIIWSWRHDSKLELERKEGFERYEPPLIPEKAAESSLIDLYINVSEDTRTLWQVTWQIPPFAVTTSSVVILAGVGYIRNPLISGIFLVLGSFLDIVLLIELRKHNFGLEVRQRFLDQLTEHLNLPALPRIIDQELNYLRKVPVKGLKQFTNLSYRRPANIGLETSVFLLSLALFSMGVYELLLFKII